MADEHSEQHGEHGGHEEHRAHSGGHAHGGGHEEGHEGAPEWLISFADNVALMMGFFVILLAMNMKSPVASHTGVGSPDKDGGVPESQMLDFVIAMRDALDRGDFEAVASLGHGMKGAGGSWGFQDITDIGAALEQAAERVDNDASRKWVGELSRYLDRVEIIFD